MILVDRLAHGNRWRARPLAEKALLALGLLALALTLPPWPGAPLVLAAAAGAAILGAGIPPLAWLRIAAPPLAFIAVGAAAMPLAWGESGLVYHGVGAALAVAARSIAAVACLLLLALTAPTAELLGGVRRLGLPAELAEVALATYRFLFVLDDTARTMRAAQAARLGHDGWRRTLSSLGLLAAALLPRALEQARRLEIGLAARGFDGGLATLSRHRPVSVARLAAILLVLAAIAGAARWA